MWQQLLCVCSPAIGRECGFAYKPSPEALLHICSVWGIAGEEAVFVGDSAKDDVRPYSLTPDPHPGLTLTLALTLNISMNLFLAQAMML